MAGRIGPDLVATHNERVRMLAGFVNATGLGLIGFAVLRPLTDTPVAVGWASVWWGGCGLVFHAVSLYILRYLRKEAGP